MMLLWDYFCEGIKYEMLLLYLGVWQGKVRLLDNQLIKENQVDIDEFFILFLFVLVVKLVFNI